ncbi:MAG: peptidylprolyl isomerase [Prevotellaceae bacterium]|jgi:peptidyl-prolyl cis-trans isomerase SurA|nr:peptidylprolyl isomerase [Prevotellaceae bacterium]
MKKYIIYIAAFAFCSNLSAQTNDPVVMTVAGKKITKSEFEYIYNKNNSAAAVNKQDLREYADLYADLKRKVAEAKAQGLDTLSSFREELKSYRSQSARPYLTDSKTEEKLVREAYDRLKEAVKVSHILIRTKTGTPEDTLAAYKKAVEIRKRLNKEDFAKVAKETSEDTGTAAKGGDVGYITGFQTVLPFEEAAYNTPVGKISQPIRSQFGYHIIKVSDRRPSQGMVQVAHIMKIFPQNVTQAQKDSLKAVLQVVYDSLKSGADFALLAKHNSEHIYTADKGGELGWFGTSGSGAGENFENAAFALKVGEYSKLTESLYGYHIIKVLDKKGLEPFDEKKAEIEKRLKSDARSVRAQQEFKKSLREEYDLKIRKFRLRSFKKTAAVTLDSVFFVKTEKLNKPLFSFKNNAFTQKDFVDYLKKYKNQPANLNDRFYAFADDKLFEYEESRLEEKYPDFKLLMQEYYDGILMFNISSKEIWERAAEDTEGLRNYFEANKAKYAWETPHFKGILVFCKDKKIAQKAEKIIAASPSDSVPKFLARALNTDKDIAVKVTSGLFAKGETPSVDKYVFGTGNYTPPADYPIVLKNGKTLTVPDDYREVKGTVISDYQNELQEKWIDGLRKKYPAEIDEKVLETVEIK